MYKKPSAFIRTYTQYMSLSRLKVSEGFGLIPVRSPLLRESRLISSPRVTEMFHFTRFASLCLYIQQKDPALLHAGGCPIRKSPGQSLFDGSPRLIAAYRVLLRLLAPRHPPIALNILTHKKNPYYPYFAVNDRAKLLGFTPEHYLW